MQLCLNDYLAPSERLPELADDNRPKGVSRARWPTAREALLTAPSILEAPEEYAAAVTPEITWLQTDMHTAHAGLVGHAVSWQDKSGVVRAIIPGKDNAAALLPPEARETFGPRKQSRHRLLFVAEQARYLVEQNRGDKPTLFVAVAAAKINRNNKAALLRALGIGLAEEAAPAVVIIEPEPMTEAVAKEPLADLPLCHWCGGKMSAHGPKTAEGWQNCQEWVLDCEEVNRRSQDHFCEINFTKGKVYWVRSYLDGTKPQDRFVADAIEEIRPLLHKEWEAVINRRQAAAEAKEKEAAEKPKPKRQRKPKDKPAEALPVVLTGPESVPCEICVQMGDLESRALRSRTGRSYFCNNRGGVHIVHVDRPGSTTWQGFGTGLPPGWQDLQGRYGWILPDGTQKIFDIRAANDRTFQILSRHELPKLSDRALGLSCKYCKEAGVHSEMKRKADSESSWRCSKDDNHRYSALNDGYWICVSPAGVPVVEGAEGAGPDLAAQTSEASEPACRFCGGEMQRLSADGWQCQADRFHRFWIVRGVQTLGVWNDDQRRQEFPASKELPAWAKE